MILAIKEMQIKRSGFHLVPIGMAIIKVTDKTPWADSSSSISFVFHA